MREIILEDFIYDQVTDMMNVHIVIDNQGR